MKGMCELGSSSGQCARRAYREVLDPRQKPISLAICRRLEHEGRGIEESPVDFDDREDAEVVECAHDSCELAEAGETHKVQFESRDVGERRESGREVLRERHVRKLRWGHRLGGERMPRVNIRDARHSESAQVWQFRADLIREQREDVVGSEEVSAVYPERPNIQCEMGCAVEQRGEFAQGVRAGEFDDAEEEALCMYVPSVAYKRPVAVCALVAITVILRRRIVEECVHDELPDVERESKVMLGHGGGTFSHSMP